VYVLFYELYEQLAQLVKYDIHTTRKIKSIHAHFLSHIIIFFLTVLLQQQKHKFQPLAHLEDFFRQHLVHLSTCWRRWTRHWFNMLSTSSFCNQPTTRHQ